MGKEFKDINIDSWRAKFLILFAKYRFTSKDRDVVWFPYLEILHWLSFIAFIIFMLCGFDAVLYHNPFLLTVDVIAFSVSVILYWIYVPIPWYITNRHTFINFSNRFSRFNNHMYWLIAGLFIPWILLFFYILTYFFGNNDFLSWKVIKGIVEVIGLILMICNVCCHFQVHISTIDDVRYSRFLGNELGVENPQLPNWYQSKILSQMYQNHNSSTYPSNDYSNNNTYTNEENDENNYSEAQPSSFSSPQEPIIQQPQFATPPLDLDRLKDIETKLDEIKKSIDNQQNQLKLKDKYNVNVNFSKKQKERFWQKDLIPDITVSIDKNTESQNNENTNENSEENKKLN